MNLTDQLLKENSKNNAREIADYIGNNSSRFKNLVAIFLNGPYLITQRSSWPLSLCVDQNPNLITSHLGVIIKFIEKPNLHNAVKRNILRVLCNLPIQKKYHASIINLCFKVVTNRSEPVAVKVHAISLLSKILVDYPSLNHELKVIIEDQLPYATSAFISRATKVLQKLN